MLIAVILAWQDAAGKAASFGIELRYHSPQTLYAIPSGGWSAFRACEEAGSLPRIAYLPPYSGLEPTEKFLDVSPIRQQVGKGQPGSVLRNLLLRVNSPSARDNGNPTPRHAPSAADWNELASVVERWFSVKISPPRYESTKDVYITVEYTAGNRAYDIFSGGSGFDQTLTLLAFLFGYQPTILLLDEPDAHLRVNLQREILDSAVCGRIAYGDESQGVLRRQRAGLAEALGRVEAQGLSAYKVCTAENIIYFLGTKANTGFHSPPRRAKHGGCLDADIRSRRAGESAQCDRHRGAGGAGHRRGPQRPA